MNRREDAIDYRRAATQVLRVSLPAGITAGTLIAIGGSARLPLRFWDLALLNLARRINVGVAVALAALGLFLLAWWLCRRWGANRHWSSRLAAGLVLGPAYLVAGYAINKTLIRNSFGPGGVLANLALASVFVLFWLLVARLLLGWVRTRILGSVRGVTRITIAALTALLLVNALAWALPRVTRGDESPNVIVFLLDALRADHLGYAGYDRNTSPNIDALADDAVVFTHAISQATFTKASIASLFTSRYPCRHGVYIGNRKADRLRITAHVLGAEEKTLAEALFDAGYLTKGLVTNHHLTPAMGFDQGFVEYDIFTFRRTAAEINELFTRWLKATGRWHRFFAYVHYMDLHDPYRPEPPFDTMFGAYSDFNQRVDFGEWSAFLKEIRDGRRTLEPGDVEQLRAYYDGLIASVDAEIGRLLDRLKALDLYDNSLIVLLADHGDGFMEHGFISHSAYPYDELLRVPLIVKFPGSRFAGRHVDEQVQLVDVMPTILDVVGAAHPPQTDGLSLLDILQEPTSKEDAASPVRVSISEFEDDQQNAVVAVRTNEFKLIHFANRPDEFYDLIADPLERNNIIESKPELAELFRNRALEVVRMKNQTTAEEQELDEESVDELRSLGYLQ